MTDVSLVDLLVRTLVSLALVLGIVGVAYLVARRRSAGGKMTLPGATVLSRRSRGSRSGRGRRRTTTPARLDVVGRVGLSRGTAAVAIRFGDRVVLVAAADGAPSTTLTEMDAARWDELHAEADLVLEPIEHEAVQAAAAGRQVPTDGVVVPRPTFVEALRQATARHA